MSSPDQNPFVGPRPIEEGRALYGRDAEVAALFHALQGRRIVLLHSPSGAGKSSLIQAGLSPRLRAAGFDVWPPVRVNHAPADPAALSGRTNRYLLSAMVSLEAGLPERYQRSEAELATLDFATYLAKRPRKKSLLGSPVVLVFDQFEEILTTEPRAIEQKYAFFNALGSALDDRGYWALFSMREDYLGAIASFRDRVPTQLSNTFRLDLLTRESARAVAVRAARDGAREFPGVDLLVEELSKVKVQGVDELEREEQGLYVEPVHLQVVGHRLWTALPPEAREITGDHVRKFANVSTALAGYYADTVARASGGDEATERAIREWVGGHLVAGGIRTPVRRGAERSGGLPNALIGLLVDSYLVRTDQRAGALWYELSHDRMVEPVTVDNRQWEEKHLHEVQRRAKLWVAGDRSQALLLPAAALPAATAWAKAHPERVTEEERKYLDESKAVRAREARQRRRERTLFAFIVLLAVTAGGVAGFAWIQKGAAERATADAERAQSDANDAATRADGATTKASESAVRAAASGFGAFLDKALAQASEGRAKLSAAEAERQRAAAVQMGTEALAAKLAAEAANTQAMNAINMQAATTLKSDPSAVVAFLARIELPAPPSWREEAEGVLNHAVLPVNVLRGGGEKLTAVAIGANHQRIVAGTATGRLLEWSQGHLARYEALTDSGPPIRDLAMSPDGTRLAWITADATDGTGLGKGWLSDDRGAPTPLPGTSAVGVWAVAFAPDGTLAVGYSTGQIAYLGPQDPLASLTPPLPPADEGQPSAVSIAWLGGSNLLAVVTDRLAMVLPRGTSTSTKGRAPAFHPAKIAASPDGTRLTILGETGSAVTWSVAGQGLKDVDNPPKLPASRALAFVGKDQDVAVGLKTGAVGLPTSADPDTRSWAAHTRAVTALAASADGERFVSASEDGTVRVWDTAHPEQPARSEWTDEQLLESLAAAAQTVCLTAQTMESYMIEYQGPGARDASADADACVERLGL